MARFRFALQPALDAALLREREARDTLLQACDRRAHLECALACVVERQAVWRSETAARLRPQSAAAFWDADAYAQALATEWRGRFAALLDGERTASSARDALQQARTYREALERLRARAREAWEAREEHRESAELDEANTQAQARGERARKYAA